MKGFIIFLVILIVSSCSKREDMMSSTNDELHNISIGSYSLLQSSIDTLPYLNKVGIVFSDSANNTIVLKIQELPTSYSKNARFYKYNVYELGDTVTYYYSSQIKFFIIKNDSLAIRFHLDLEAKPYYSDPHEEYVADVLSIFYHNIGTNGFGSVFYHKTNPRTWPDTWTLTPLNEKTIMSRKFYDVLHNQYNNPLSIVFFNYRFGIVSFTDNSGKLWRFERFI